MASRRSEPAARNFGLVLILAAAVVAVGAQGGGSLRASLNDSSDHNNATDDAEELETHAEALEVLMSTNESARFTWEGCQCIRRWRLAGHAVQPVVDYCGNPDEDLNGEWCFVIDHVCQGHLNWGYCAPEPRCSIGDQVLVEGYRPAVVASFHGRLVGLQWGDGLAGLADISDLSTLGGETCLHMRSSAAHAGKVSTTDPFVAIPVDPMLDEAMVTVTTTTSSGVGEGGDGLPSLPWPPFHPVFHGHALSLRLDLAFDDVVPRRAGFEGLVRQAVAGATRQPEAAVQVLSLMRGSVIVAVGVVPWACATPHAEAPAACSRELMFARQRWQVAIWDPGAPIHRLLGRIDPTFPAFLDSNECSVRGLACSWLDNSTSRAPCTDGLCAQPAGKAEREEDPWWLMSLLAFASATPTCFCLGVVLLKACVRCCRCLRRRWDMQGVKSEVCALPRQKVCEADLGLEPGWMCSICLGSQCAGSEVLMLPCKHMLHFDCVLEWFKLRGSCPMCRTRVRFKECVLYSVASGKTVEDSKVSPVGAGLTADETAAAPAPGVFGAPDDAPCGPAGEGKGAAEEPSSSSSRPADAADSEELSAFTLPNAIAEDRSDPQVLVQEGAEDDTPV